MTDIKSYSKEWIVSRATKNQKEAFTKVSNNEMKKLKEQGNLTSQTFNYDLLVGTKEEIISKYNVLKQSEKNEKECDLIEKFGGIENVINMIDMDGDEKIVRKEFLELAGYDTPDWEPSNNVVLSAKDMYDVYTNVSLAKDATVKQEGYKTTFNYKNGSKTVIEQDKTGDVISKHNSDNLVNDRKRETFYDYKNQTKTETIYDKQGREESFEIDKAGKKDDYTIKNTYNNNGTIQKYNTVGREVVSTYDTKGNLLTETKTFKYKSDGVIENSKQSSIGDCWLLAQLNTLRDTKIGKQVIKDAIKTNKDGTVTVTFKQVGRSYTFTPEQICSRDYTSLDKKYSTGDDDVRILELAFTEERKYLLEHETAENFKEKYSERASMEDPLRAGAGAEAIQLLTGIKPKYNTNKNKMEKELDKKMKDVNRYAVTVSFKAEDASISVTNSGKSNIVTGHRYSVSRVTKDTVYVVNPWDSSKEIAYPKDKFLDNCKGVSLADLNEYKSK